ncbi:HepT-like ribonuclease domain-containing protein [Enterococcus casseliflavus]|uniref:HepT-like ribonuclease domain-containing protein n=1 Tax=Enterococcus casseliflavus TaxID=37734 RepID=UPI003A4E621D
MSWDLYRLFRNDLVHAYNTIDLKEIWYFVQNDLKPLEEYVRYILIEGQVN